MLYFPPNPRLRLWDTWLLQTGDAIHLFHLQRERAEVGCSSIGHAITRDWLHWETLPPVLEQGTGTSWDAGPLMTGMTLEHGGRYYMFYGAMTDRVQRIGLAVSDDLLHWEKVGSGPVLEPGGPWYENDPVRATNYETAWRDPYVFFHAPENAFYAFICARVQGGGDTGGGCIAVARSENMLDWTLLPPAYTSDSLTCLEVPEYFALNGHHYLSYTTSYHFGTPYPLHDPHQATGTFYLISEDMLRGYRGPDHGDVLTASLPNTTANYVGRSIPVAGSETQRLYYYHHVFPPRPGESLAGALGAPKLMESSTDGRLALRYAADVFAGEDAPDVLSADPLGSDTLLTLAADDLAGANMVAEISAPYAGLCFHIVPGREDTLEGLAVWLAPTTRGSDQLVVMLGTVHFSNGPHGLRPAFGNPAALRRLDNTVRFGSGEIRLRVVYRGPFVDVFVNEQLYLSHTYDPDLLPEAGGAGPFYAGAPKHGAVMNVRLQRLPGF